MKEKEKKKDGGVEIRKKKTKKQKTKKKTNKQTKEKGNLRLGVEIREKYRSGGRWVLIYIYIYITAYFGVCHRIF